LLDLLIFKRNTYEYLSLPALPATARVVASFFAHSPRTRRAMCASLHTLRAA